MDNKLELRILRALKAGKISKEEAGFTTGS